MPQTQNGYSYVGNNPINFSDPSGLDYLLDDAALVAGATCVIVAGKIAGYTKHGINQAIGRDGGKGVNPQAILNAVRDPNKVLNEVDKHGRESVKYIGDNATIVLNNGTSCYSMG